MIAPSLWLDTDRMREVFGIKIKFEGKWMHAGDDSGIFLFDTEEERDNKMIELRTNGFPAKAE